MVSFHVNQIRCSCDGFHGSFRDMGRPVVHIGSPEEGGGLQKPVVGFQVEVSIKEGTPKWMENPKCYSCKPCKQCSTSGSYQLK